MITTRTTLVVAAAPEEQEAFRESARAAAFELRLEFVERETDALTLLKAPPAGWRPPDLILLNAPPIGLQAQECVRRIRQETPYRRTPKVVLIDPRYTGSLTGYYLAGANCCVTKPAELAELPRVLKGIYQFWLNCVMLPDPMKASA